MKVKAKYYREGVKYAGPCALCGRMVDPKRSWEASLYWYVDARGQRRYVPVHDECAGVRKKNKIGGGRVAVHTPEIEIEV